MGIDRRNFLLTASSLLAGSATGLLRVASADTHEDKNTSTTRQVFRKIATEEAFSVPSVAQGLKQVARTMTGQNLDINLIRSFYDDPTPDSFQGKTLQRLLDLGELRLRAMDENDVNMHLLSLTAPGVQLFDADTATDLAHEANNILADAVNRHPTRFAGLASFAPHSPKRAAKEMERAIQNLKLHGFVVNSHTNNEYMDDPKFWPIFEAAEALDAAIYIHPRAPSEGMANPFRAYALDSAMWGYGVETATHAIRLIMNGVFEQFPKLKIVLGHMGEGIPFWLWRIDYMHNAMSSGGTTKKLVLKPSEYFIRNFTITTSGVESHEALQYSINVLGAENVMWAIDYPYQPTTPAVKFMDTAPIPDQQKELIYHGNAERIFHISS